MKQSRMTMWEWLNDLEPENTGLIPYLKNTIKLFIFIGLCILAVYIIVLFLRHAGFQIFNDTNDKLHIVFPS